MPVVGQVEVGGAGTLVPFSRGEQAEVAAAPVVCLAWVIEHCGHERRERETISTLRIQPFSVALHTFFFI